MFGIQQPPYMVSRNAVRNLITQLLSHDAIRGLVAKARYTYYRRFLRRLKVHQAGGDTGENTVRHNLNALPSDFAVNRSLLLVRPLSVIDTLDYDTTKILAMGCRTEGELLALVGYGFKPSNIRGFDLISYSPWVDCGDMHALPYANGSWDVVTLSNLIAYSNNPKVVASEVARVVKPGGLVAISEEWSTPANREATWKRAGYVPGGSRLESFTVAELVGLFGARVDRVIVAHDHVAGSRTDSLGAIYTIFSLK